jgi:hypothetical protein
LAQFVQRKMTTPLFGNKFLVVKKAGEETEVL